MKRARLRSVAHLVEELDGHLTDPENLNQNRLLRIEAAFRAGFGNVIHTALAESSLDDPQTQWQLLLPILTEAENPPAIPRNRAPAAHAASTAREKPWPSAVRKPATATPCTSPATSPPAA